MAGLNNILDHIKSESDKIVDNIVSEAKNYADSLQNDFKKKAEEEVSKINKKCELELKSITDRSISSSELKKKQISLMVKQQLIMETIEKAKEKLINLPDSEYIDYIKKVFVKNIPNTDCEIIFNEKDKKRITKDVIDEFTKLVKEKGATLKVSDKVANIKSGFILNFGDVEGNCSFESLIDQNIENLVDKVNQTLFD